MCVVSTTGRKVSGTAMPKLLITIGLPGSGKSTWARHQQLKNPNVFISERDVIREKLFGTRRDFDHEGQVTAYQESEVALELAVGNDVIVADTNLNTKTQKRWRNTASKHGAEFETKSFLDLDVYEVIQRDFERDNPDEIVGEKVIMDFAKRYGLVPPATSEFAQVVLDPTLPLVTIVDIDGTCALMGARSPYEHGKYHLDHPNGIVRDVLGALVAQGNRILYCSGRKQAAKTDTEAWLAKHGFPVGAMLLMRKDDDNRKDSIVKYEILRDVISQHFYPVLVLDDRNQVVEMWRSQGIPTFQVAPGDF